MISNKKDALQFIELIKSISSNGFIGINEDLQIKHILDFFNNNPNSNVNNKTGDLWISLILNNKPDNVILDGETFNGDDYPELFLLTTTTDLLTDNGDNTATLNFQGHFPRPNLSDIGLFKTDTTAVNGLSGTSQDRFAPNFTGRGNGGNVARQGNTTTNRSISFSGDSETAPIHVNMLFGLYV